MTPPASVAPDLAIRDPEHLIKIAYTARSQAAHSTMRAYVAVVDRYLGGDRPMPTPDVSPKSADSARCACAL